MIEVKSLEDLRGGDNLDEISIDKHVLIEVLVALFLVEFQLEFVGVHVVGVELLEGRAKVGVYIGTLVPILGGDTGQLPRAFRPLNFAVLILVQDWLDLPEEVKSAGTVDSTTLRKLLLQVQEGVVVLENVEVLLVDERL